jgi:hypothetical protein
VISSVDAGRQPKFGLRGTVKSFVFLDRDVFVGTPAVIQTVDGNEQLVGREKVEVREAAPGSQWRIAVGSTIGGEARLRVVDQGETLFLTSFAVVPPDFEIELEPSNVEQGAGQVYVRCSSLDTVALGVGKFECRVTRQRHEHRLDLRANAAQLEPLDLLLRFTTGELSVRLPFPARLLAFTDRTGKPLPTNTALSILALGGIHARCLAPPGRMPRAIDVEARIASGPVEYVGGLDDRTNTAKEPGSQAC